MASRQSRRAIVAFRLRIDSRVSERCRSDALSNRKRAAIEFNGQAFTVLPRVVRPAAMITPPSLIAPPTRVDTVGICRIEGMIAPNRVAPTGSPSTVRLTTYAGRNLRAQFIPVCPSNIGPRARPAKIAISLGGCGARVIPRDIAISDNVTNAAE